MAEHADEIKFRLLTYYIADLPLRDQRETMERPFFSLSKRKRVKPIDYRSPDGKVWVEVSPHQKYGMATIWDADVLIWAASQILEHKRRGEVLGRVLRFRPNELLRAIGRVDKRTGKASGERYTDLKAALDRLKPILNSQPATLPVWPLISLGFSAISSRRNQKCGATPR